MRDAQLSTVLDTWEPQVMPVSLVSAGQSAVPQKLRAFLDYAIQQLKQRLQDA